jgi:RNA polymerase sigma factor (sigma-70 family)
MFSTYTLEPSLLSGGSMTKMVAMNNHIAHSNTSIELERVYFEHLNDLTKMARLLVDDLNSANDVVQEAFEKALKAQPTFKNDDALFYMKRAVMNCAKSNLRKRATSRKHLSVVQVEDTQLSTKEEIVDLPIDAQLIHQALANLSERQRECVVAFHTHKLSYKEIAELLEISEGSVKQHLSRGLKNLSEALGGAK